MQCIFIAYEIRQSYMCKTVIKNDTRNIWLNAKKLAVGKLSLSCDSLMVLISINF